MNRTTTVVALVLAGLSLSHAAAEDTITVCSVGCDFTSINAAIDSAEDGDVIALSPGFYYEGEEVNFDGKGITLRGSVDANGDPSTVLDGLTSHRVLRATDGMPDGVEIIIENLIIQNGFVASGINPGRGAGLYIEVSNVAAITNCTFRANLAAMGAGMFCRATDPVITKCTFEDNVASWNQDGGSLGGGLFLESSDPIISECRFLNNAADWSGGGACFAKTNHTLQDCYFAFNKAGQGGAIAIRDEVALTLSGCTITRNFAMGIPVFGAPVAEGAAMLIDPESLATLADCYVWCNYGDSTMAGPFVQVSGCIDEDQGCTDQCGTDSDLDGVIDPIDVCPGEDDYLDTDQDGTPDCIDGCPLDPERTNPGPCGCGPSEDVAGDLDCDGDYDADDVRLAMAEFGIIEASDCQGDVNGDGNVDAADLGLLIGAWGICP